MHFRAVCFALLTAACASWAAPAAATTYILTGNVTGVRQQLLPTLQSPTILPSLLSVELDFTSTSPTIDFQGLALITPIDSATFLPQGGNLVSFLLPANSYFAVGTGVYAGRAGFGVYDSVAQTLETYIGFGAAGLAGYDGVSSFAATSVAMDHIDVFDTFNSNNGVKAEWNFSSFSNATFTAIGAAVPEPATWAMMLVGFGAIGFAMRNARQKAAAASLA